MSEQWKREGSARSREIEQIEEEMIHNMWRTGRKPALQRAERT